MASLRAQIVRQVSEQYMKRVRVGRDVSQMRAGLEAWTGILPPARGVSVRKESVDGVECEIYVPKDCDNAPLIYYLHGGAYVMGSPATHRRLVSYVAREAGMRALLPDYRLAPEHRFPAQLEDSLRVYRALLCGGIKSSNIAIGGDSAGGNLTMATLLSLRNDGDAMPAACFLMSPWLDLNCDGESYRSRAELDPWFSPEQIPAIAGKFCSDEEKENPLVSPVLANVADMPTTFIQVGDHEILLSDSTRLADNIKTVGGNVELQVWPEMWHVFQFFIGQMPESTKAIRKIGKFLKSEFSNRTDDTDNSQAA